METKHENGEVVFFNEAPWLITNTRICWPNGVIRISDMRGVEMVSQDKGLPVRIVGFILIVVGLCIGWPLSFKLMTNLFSLLFVIGGICAIRASSRFNLKLTGHCLSGKVVLMQIEYPPESKAQFTLSRDKMKSIQDAILKALVHSTTPR